MQLHTKRFLQKLQIRKNAVQITKPNDLKQKYSGCVYVFLMASVPCATLTVTSRAGQGLPENETKQQRIAVDYIQYVSASLIRWLYKRHLIARTGGWPLNETKGTQTEEDITLNNNSIVLHFCGSE